MLTLLIFILILSFLVFVHELGHFLTAKKAGIKVEEFGFGIPPRIFGKKVGDTLYSLNLLPFGGFVKLYGEDEEEDYEKVLKDNKSFISKKPWVRAVILTAGVFMNLIFAFLFYYIVFSMNGYKSTVIPLYIDHNFRFGEQKNINTVITAVEDDTPAYKAGINFGEAIIEVDDVPVYSIPDLRKNLEGKEGKDVKLLLMDVRSSDRKIRSVSLTPIKNEQGELVFGVYLGAVTNIHYETRAQKLLAGPMHAYNVTAYSLRLFGAVLLNAFETKDTTVLSASVSGPVGVFGIVGEILKGGTREGILSLLDLTALLSLSLALMNLMPFPALDGGRLAFVLVEMVRGKRIHPSKEAMVHRIGMAVLLLMIVLVTFKDVRNLIS